MRGIVQIRCWVFRLFEILQVFFINYGIEYYFNDAVSFFLRGLILLHFIIIFFSLFLKLYFLKKEIKWYGSW